MVMASYYVIICNQLSQIRRLGLAKIHTDTPPHTHTHTPRHVTCTTHTNNHTCSVVQLTGRCWRQFTLKHF